MMMRMLRGSLLVALLLPGLHAWLPFKDHAGVPAACEVCESGPGWAPQCDGDCQAPQHHHHAPVHACTFCQAPVPAEILQAYAGASLCATPLTRYADPVECLRVFDGCGTPPLRAPPSASFV